ncbi:MAG TPA: DNA-protecting protein DprA [candidate division Zixibacteria bacterium]|nr:DNA-protecting protein DprA [candidate division Zixibacteria bacterium]
MGKKSCCQESNRNWINKLDNERLQNLADLIALNEIEGIGLGRLHQLLNTFGSAGKALEASISRLTDVPGIGRETASTIIEKQDRKKAEKIVEKVNSKGWRFFIINESDYPRALKTIPDPPPYIFYLGEYEESDNRAIAIVGSRTATEEGRSFAENLAARLAENGVTVVSGMARGVDTAAHRGAMTAEGRTLAVFGSSLDIIYPPEGRNMAAKIIKSGCLLSEYLPGTEPFGPNFPKRNRIISGLSQGVVVIEAAERSGALSTAGHALQQNREIFAVPGSPRVLTSKGTNHLIKEGAVLLTSIDDIFEALPRLKGQVIARRTENIEDLTELEKSILNHFGADPIQVDKLARETNTPMPDLLQILLALELKGIVKELSGKRFILG